MLCKVLNYEDYLLEKSEINDCFETDAKLCFFLDFQYLWYNSVGVIQ